MGKVDGSSTFSGNNWEEVRKKNDVAIKKWIAEQMAMRSCIVVLIGNTTSTRPWIKYEIEKAYELEKGIVGIYIDRLKDQNGEQCSAGANPFNQVYTRNGTRLSNYVTVFKTRYISSEYAYDDIKENIEQLIEEAIEKAGTY
jgi:hypothetical protein